MANEHTMNELLESSTGGKNHRRQTSHGLEINTSKTNSFFHTADVPTPRPPPSISRKISIKQTPNSTSTSISPPSPSSIKITEEEEEEDTLYHHDSYANRLRNLVASTRQASVAPAPSPIPQYLNAKKPYGSLESPLRSPFDENQTMVDELLSLPTPHVPAEPRHFVFPIQEISVISSDIIRPSLSNEIPRLSENLKLGDQDIMTMRREPVVRKDELETDLVGKQIGSYRISRLLGVGAFSHVYLAHHVDTAELFAIKTIQKGRLLDDPRVRSSMEREVGVLKFIDHPNIVHLEATMETEHMMCIVLEYVEGGELFDFVQKMHQETTSVDEEKVKKVFLQVLNAVKWLHGHNIVHRDLKLENILIQKKDNDEILKITDFGLARVVDPESPLLTTRCGSEEYAAPEIIQQSKDGYDGRKTDTWSLGIILYALLVGYLPFRYDPRKNERVSQLFYRIVRAEVKWPADTQISPEAKHVVRSILERNPDKRISIHQIEDLPWFQTTTTI
ncbi:hypothetical protein INT47_011709 [Mucor saturninus]|uniref:Protein kinase domain-containing protein n=1 Tax=Mucor saturninus TaxID=64648 RepID=A0A8H7V1F2_9FUNG|nr:hypothetical protein INT47_011709 [Mucor saturninus]